MFMVCIAWRLQNSGEKICIYRARTSTSILCFAMAASICASCRATGTTAQLQHLFRAKQESEISIQMFTSMQTPAAAGTPSAVAWVDSIIWAPTWACLPSGPPDAGSGQQRNGMLKEAATFSRSG